MRRFLALLLVMAMIVGMFIGCADEQPETPEDPKQDEENPKDPTEEQIVPNIAEKDYNTTINVLHAKVWDVVWEDIATEDIREDVLAHDIFSRNSWLEEHYGIKMTVNHEGTSNTQTMIIAQQSSGDDDWQLYMQRGYGFGKVLGKEYFLNMAEIENIDLSHPWWSKGAIDALSFGDYVEICASDMIFGDKGGTSSMYFNKAIAQELNLSGFYEDVLNKQWTMEKLAEYAEKGNADLNGDDTMDGNDRYGIASGDQSTFMYGCFGLKLVNHGDDGYFYYEYGTGDTIDAMVSIFETILYQDFFYNTFIHRNDSVIPKFDNNQSLLTFGNIKGCNTYRSMDMDYGVLPYPMMDENQEDYYSLVSQHSDALFAVPATVSDKAAVGAALELLSYYSYYNVYGDFYDKIICGRGTRDDESVEMLKIIFANRVYDMGLIFDDINYNDHLLRYTSTGNTSLASDFKSYEGQLEQQVAALNELVDNYN